MGKPLNKQINIQNPKELNIFEMFKIIWKDRILVLVIILISVFCSIYYLKTSSYLYYVSVSILPTDKPLSNQTSASNTSGIAGVLGLSLGRSANANSSEFNLYKLLLISKLSSNILKNDKELMKKLFPSEINVIDGSWIKPEPTFWSQSKDYVKNLLGLKVYPPEKPGGDRIYEFIQKNVKIHTDYEKNITTVSLLTDRPKIGEMLLYKMHLITEQILKDRAKHKADKYIKYLLSELEKTYQNDQRVSLIRNLAVHQHNRMTATTDLPYAAEFLGHINISSRHVEPKASSILVIGLLSGFILSLFLVFIKVQLFNKK